MSAVRAGLSGVAAVAGRELYSYLVSPIIYAVTGVFLLINSVIFFFFILSRPGAEASLRDLLPTMAFLLLLILPVMTMRLLADERASGTIELLMTFPVTDAQVVVGKYLATLVVYLLMLLPTLVYVAIVKYFGNSEWAPLICSYLGLVLLGASFIAVGLFSSSLTRNQIVAGVLGIGILLLIWLLDGIFGGSRAPLASALAYLALQNHFQTMSQGVLDLKDVVFFCSFIAGALFLTVRIMESERWRV